jgi:cell division protein FtsW
MQLNISSIRTDMSFFYRQFVWFLLSGIFLWIGFKLINLEKLRRYNILFILGTLTLLILVLLIGDTVKGATRSISILGINFQPTLIARLILLIYCAHILDKKKDYIENSHPKQFLTNFFPIIFIAALFYILILIQKHFTPLIISVLTIISLLYLVRIKLTSILTLFFIALVFITLVIQFGPQYRSERMDIYAQYSLPYRILGTASEYEGEKDYQVRESLIALSSGKMFGTSPARGIGKHYFLPEAKTDYIFAIIGEEFGFLGALLIIFLFCFLFFRTIISSSKQSSLFYKLTGYGLGMNIFFNAMINIGVAISVLPSTGVTLPFISYGGTSLLINSFSIGLLLNVTAERRTI